MGLRSKDLLGLKQLTAEEIMEILDTAKMMKLVLTSGNKKTSHLQGKSVVTLFYETAQEQDCHLNWLPNTWDRPVLTSRHQAVR